jgi:hypothetical protein
MGLGGVAGFHTQSASMAGGVGFDRIMGALGRRLKELPMKSKNKFSRATKMG